VQFFVGVIVVGIVINLISDYLGTNYRPAERPLIEFAAVGIAIWAATLVTDIAYSRFTAGRYAVEALILNGHDELLLYHHPYHKCMLPPGGRVKRSEFPNLALQLRLQERLNLSPAQYKFDERFHHGLDANSGNLGEIQRLAAPFIVQREVHKQRAFVQSHYDFIYVLKLLSDDISFKPSRYDPVHFVDLNALKDMVSQRRTFPDVLEAYKRMLDISARELQ
jgi:hypothetical protein